MSNVHQSNLPYAQSKRLFDRMAPYIGEALRAFPAAIVVDPRKESMSSESFAGYFRKARTSKQMMEYKHPAIDEEQFAEHAEHLVCAFGKGEHVGKLIIGPRNYGEIKPSVAYGAVQTLATTSRFEIQTGNMFAIMSVCELVAHKALSPMPEFVVRNVSQKDIDELMARYDVTIVPLDDTNKLHQIL